MHAQHCDVMYDITAPFKDVTLANKMMRFGHAVSKACPPQNCLKQLWTDKSTMAMAHPEHQVSHAMPHPPPHIWVCPHNRSLQPLFIIISTSFVTKSSKVMKNCKSGVLSGDARPNCRPPAQRSSNSDSFTCTSTAIATSIGGNQSIGDPGICGVTGLQV